MRKRTWLTKKDRPCKRGKGACKQGKRCWDTGRKVRSGSLRPPALINKGARPYSWGRPAVYAGAGGRIRLLYLGTVLLREKQLYQLLSNDDWRDWKADKTCHNAYASHHFYHPVVLAVNEFFQMSTSFYHHCYLLFQRKSAIFANNLPT